MFRLYAQALAEYANGNELAADAALQELIRDDADESGSQIATIYALRKDPDKAFEWLDHALASDDGGVVEILLNPFLLACKDDPRFIAIARKVGVMSAAKP